MTSKRDIVCSGGFFLAKDTKRFLFLLRNQGKTAGTWGLVGGKVENKETPAEALIREIQEEVGAVDYKKIIPLELFTSEDQHFFFNTYVILVENEFIPTLYDEHVGYAWCSYNKWAKPLHQRVKRSLSNKTNKTKLELILDLI